MADATIAWDATNNRGDWVFNAPSVTQTAIAVPAPVQFAVGDGVAAQFALLPAQNQISSVVAQIFRSDWQGNQLLYATARTNLLTQSQAFDNAAWTKSASSITPNVKTAPDGTTTMDKLVEDSTNSQHYVSRLDQTILPNTAYSVGVFASAAERRFLCVGWRTGGSWVGGQPSATFDLVAGTVNLSGTGATASIQSLGGGIYKCMVSAVSGASGFSSGPFYQLLAAGGTLGVSYLGDGASGAYVWGGQAEVGSVSTSYIPTTTSAVTVTDYALSSSGLVACSSPPLLAAALSWTGSYVLNTFNGGGSLATGDDLQTAIIISIFSDRMAQPGDVIPGGSNDPRGWWADDTVPIGSRLWLLRRAKQTKETLQKAYDYLAEALQWMVDDGVVGRFDISTQWVRTSVLGAQITAYKPDGTLLTTGRYTWAWEGIN